MITTRLSGNVDCMESLSSNFEEIGIETGGISGINIGGGMDLDTVYAGFPSPAEEFIEKET